MFILKRVIDNANTGYKLVTIDVTKKENHLPVDPVDLGTGTKSLLKSKDIPEGSKHKFKKECVVMLIALIGKSNHRVSLSCTKFSRSVNNVIVRQMNNMTSLVQGYVNISINVIVVTQEVFANIYSKSIL